MTSNKAMLCSNNPATGEQVGVVPVTDAEQVGDVVARARRAQPEWNQLGAKRRRDMLLPAGAALNARADTIGELLTREMGKPLREAISEVQECAALADELDEMVDALAPEVKEEGTLRSTIYHDPFGVAAAITPWNFPFAMPHWMALPALMAGNTVILKPSEETPLVAQAYVDWLGEFLPDDVLQIVHGGDGQGKTLVAADVDLIAFTGSRETGKKILSAASHDLKRVILELGGKDPLVVLEDADIKAAAKFAARNSFRNAGQVCVSTERIYVHDSIADEFVSALVAEADKMPVGDGLAEDTRVGPMIGVHQRDHVLSQIDDAIRSGAKLAHDVRGHHDNFVMPTVLTDVTHDMSIARDETFGPVACVMRFKDEDEAIQKANDTPFGLGASVFGEKRAAQIARRLTAGMIGINRGVGGAPGTPWVGAQQSGYGFHGSPDGHRQFAQTRVVSQTIQ